MVFVAWIYPALPVKASIGNELNTCLNTTVARMRSKLKLLVNPGKVTTVTAKRILGGEGIGFSFWGVCTIPGSG